MEKKYLVALYHARDGRFVSAVRDLTLSEAQEKSRELLRTNTACSRAEIREQS